MRRWSDAVLDHGRATAKSQNVAFGRKPKLTPHQQREAAARVAAGTAADRCRNFNVSQSAIVRLPPKKAAYG